MKWLRKWLDPKISHVFIEVLQHLYQYPEKWRHGVFADTGYCAFGSDGRLLYFVRNHKPDSVWAEPWPRPHYQITIGEKRYNPNRNERAAMHAMFMCWENTKGARNSSAS